MPTFGINRLFYFVRRMGHVRIGYADMPHVLLCYVIMVDHELVNVDNHYDSLIKYAIYLSIIGNSCLKKYCWHILYTLGIICHKYFFIHT